MNKSAFGDINEAEIHYDFDRAPWLHHMKGKEYTAGDGHTFGLGKLNNSHNQNIRRLNSFKF